MQCKIFPADQSRCLLTSLYHGTVEIQQGSGVFFLIGHINSTGVVEINRKPGRHPGRAETRVGAVSPLHGCATFITAVFHGQFYAFTWRESKLGDRCAIYKNGDIIPKLADIIQQQVGHPNLFTVIYERCTPHGED
jgi:hypothetical protein